MKNCSFYSLIILLCFFFTSFLLTAQTKTSVVKGTVNDSLTKIPLEFITVALKKDNLVLKTIVTPTAGGFSFDVAPGKYLITVLAVGYSVKNIPVETDQKKQLLDLGKIYISAQTNKLSEVSIVADRPLIKQEVDRITYDIQADPESKILTALDMMRKVPLLSLDADDNIQLKGSGNYKILINGKPSNMVARSPKDVLRAMPATSIQKIEVITTPPAKYDSEGLAGLINIITTKKLDNGYNGSVNIRHQGAAGGPGAGLYLTVKQNKFGVTAYGGTGIWNSPTTRLQSSRSTIGDLPTSLSSEGTRKNKNHSSYGGAEFSYEIDTLNLLTAEINPYGGNFESRNNQRFLFTNGTNDINYDLLSNNRFEWSGLDLTFNYQRGFKSNKERLFTFSYKYSNSLNPQENNLEFSNRVNYNLPNYIQQNNSKSKEQTLQLDYVHPVKKLIVEGGLKGILRDNQSVFETRNYVESAGNYQVDPSRTNSFNNNQDIVGAYNSYTYNLESWSFKGGVRLEGTFVKADFISTGSNVNTDYYNVIPSVSINRKFKNSKSLNLGYTQRIERPGIDNLNPFVDRTNPLFESTGNPDLEAVLSNNFDLTYSTFKKGSVNVGLSYMFANNTIQSVSIYDETSNVTRTTFLNIGKDKSVTTNLNVNYPITPKWNFTLGGNIGYIWLQGSIDGALAKNNGIRGYAYINTGYKFEDNWRVNGSINYNAPQILLQGKSGAFVYTSFNGSKDIIKDKLSLSAGIANPFNKYRYYRVLTEGANFTQNYKSQNYSRTYSVSINWKFGKLKDSIAKNKRSINNDDVKSSGGSTSN